MRASDCLIIHTDGGSRGNPGPAALGVVVYDETNAGLNAKPLHEIHQLLGIKTNNEAEYSAFAVSLDWVGEYEATHQIERITWKLDSKLVVEQLNGNWKVKEPRLRERVDEILKKLKQLKHPIEIRYVPRAENAAADRLVNFALDHAS